MEIKYDSKGQKNPAWIQNVIQADKDKKRAQPYEKLFGSGTCEESVTAASEDQTHGHIHTVCPVEIRFVTEDETVIHPEELTLNQENLAYKLSYDYTGTIYTKIKNKTGFGVRDTLVAKILPDLPKEERYEPYDRTILWHSSDPDVIKSQCKSRIYRNMVYKENAVYTAEYARICVKSYVGPLSSAVEFFDYVLCCQL